MWVALIATAFAKSKLDPPPNPIFPSFFSTLFWFTAYYTAVSVGFVGVSSKIEKVNSFERRFLNLSIIPRATIPLSLQIRGFDISRDLKTVDIWSIAPCSNRGLFI